MAKIVIVTLVITLVILTAVLLWRGSTSPQIPRGGTLILSGGAKIAVEIADDPGERSRGLSGRAELEPNAGLLFVFDQPSQPGFWMKEMNFPIDIIWIDENWQIAEITPNLTPETYPQTFFPSQPIKYVLEVNAGRAQEYNLIVGDQLKYSTKSGSDTSPQK